MRVDVWQYAFDRRLRLPSQVTLRLGGDFVIDRAGVLVYA
jgi:hypothetical protein